MQLYRLNGQTMPVSEINAGYGCPFGGYFSTQSSTLPAAMKTGNLTLRPWAIVTKILYDKDKKKATGVEVLDAETNKTYTYNAKIVFVNASALNSAWILMNSATDVWPDGLGSSSGELGHNVMDHHLGVGCWWIRWTVMKINIIMADVRMEFIFRVIAISLAIKEIISVALVTRAVPAVQGGAARWQNSVLVAEFKEAMSEPGEWNIGMGGFGEILPYHENKITLDKTKKDKWGLNVFAIRL